MESVIILELHARTPLIITAKRGKGNFYESSDHVPSTTLLGAIVASFIKTNVKNQLGNCKNLQSPNDMLQCDTCPEQANCAFYKAGVEGQGKFAVSPGFPLPHHADLLWDLKDVYPCYKIKSIVERRLPSESSSHLIADNLLFSSAQKIADQYDESVISPEWLFKKPHVEGDTRIKSSSFTGLVAAATNDSEEHDVSIVIPTDKYLHRIFYRSLAIAPTFRSSARGMLYGTFALDAGTRFSALAFVGDPNIKNSLNEVSQVQVGLGKSKGWGQLELHIKKEWPSEDFVTMRKNGIIQGFERINSALDLKRGCVVTFTLLSPLPASRVLGNNPTDPRNDLYQKILELLLDSRENARVVNFFYRMVPQTTFFSKPDSSSRKVKPHFKLQDVFMPGSVGSFFISNDIDLDGLAAALAQKELNLLKENIFIVFNHPIHQVKTTI